MGQDMTAAGCRYGPAWKSVVDRDSGCEDWRAYNEALSCVKKFFRLQYLEGREEAKLNWKSYLALVESKRGAASADRLKSDFELIGTYEGAQLRAAVESAADAELRSAQAEEAGAPIAA